MQIVEESGSRSRARRLLKLALRRGGRRARAARCSRRSPRSGRCSTSTRFYATPWRRGRRLVDEHGRPLPRRRHRGGHLLHRVPRGRRQGGSSPSPLVRRPARRRRRSTCRASSRGYAADGIVAYSKICTHAGCAISLYRAPLFAADRAEAGARLPVPLLDLRPGDRRHRDLRARPGASCRCCRSRSTRSGDLRAAGNFDEPGRPVVVGRPATEADARDPRGSSASSTSAPAAAPLRCARRCATCSPTTGRSCSARSRSTAFIVLVATGIYLTLFFEHSTRDGRLPRRRTRRCRGSEMTRGLPLGARHLDDRQGGPADPPDAPLGGRRLRRRDRPAPAADLLHRRVPQAARADLLDRPDDPDGRAARGLPRLLARRRPALRDGARDRRTAVALSIPFVGANLGRADLGRAVPGRARRSSRGCTSRTCSCSRR